MSTIKSRLSATALVAPCGINCRVCRAFMINQQRCPGCRGDDTFKARSCVQCKIKNCDKLAAGELRFCFECEDFPCQRIAHLDKRYRTRYATRPIQNLLSIKLKGIREFVRSEAQRWACPRCGAALCMHVPECISCGYVWHA